MPWDASADVGLELKHNVSILVLVEVLPWAAPGRCVFLAVTSFNPCSGGSIALGSPPPGSSLFIAACFNPCSGGSIALGRMTPHDLCTQAIVSILVLVEVLPWEEGKGKGGDDNGGFNPCSGGSIALGRLRRRWKRICLRSFNPCSGGSIALGKNGCHPAR